MGSNYRSVRNGNGTMLAIDEERYISVGKGGKDIMLRGNNVVLAFDSWDDLVGAADTEKAAYYSGSRRK